MFVQLYTWWCQSLDQDNWNRTRFTEEEQEFDSGHEDTEVSMMIPKRRQVISCKNKNLESEKRSQSNIQILDCLCIVVNVREITQWQCKERK